MNNRLDDVQLTNHQPEFTMVIRYQPWFWGYIAIFSHIFPNNSKTKSQYFPYVPIFFHIFFPCFPMFSTRFWMISALQVDLIPVDLGARSTPAPAACPSRPRRSDLRRGAGAAAACCGNACMATAEAGVFWDHQDEDSWIYDDIYIYILCICIWYYHIVWQCHICFFGRQHVSA